MCLQIYEYVHVCIHGMTHKEVSDATHINESIQRSQLLTNSATDQICLCWCQRVQMYSPQKVQREDLYMRRNAADCVAVYCSVLQCAAVYCSLLQRAALCCTVLHCVALGCSMLHCIALCCTVSHCVALCCTVLHCHFTCPFVPTYS